MSASIVATLARTLAADEMEDAAELTVGVASAGLQFDGGLRPHRRRIGRVEPDAAELEPVDEQPDAVPAHRLDVGAEHQVAEPLHRVGPALHSEHADLGGGVER